MTLSIRTVSKLKPFWAAALGIALTITGLPATSYGTPWNLPLTLSDSNTQIRFEVDSTWHMVHGTTRSIQGRAWLENTNDPRSIRAKITIPVPSFNTANESRDKKMLRVMHADRYPDVIFEIVGVSDICLPEQLETTPSCAATLETKVTINNTPHTLILPATVTKKGNSYLVQGSTSLNWSDFGVEDPSIFIAKLAKMVTVTFNVQL